MIPILLFAFLIGGCQSYNSNTGDKAKFAVIELENNPQFRAAYKVIQSRCINCHSGTHNTWATYVNSQLWIDKGLVVKASASNSRLVKRIINSGETGSNMPPEGGPLPNDEYQTIVDWINGL
jgi:uncharacterized membrane protein